MASPLNALRALLLFGALVLTIWIGWGAAEPPAALPADAPVSIFSAGRAIADIHAVAVRPHPTGSADNARVGNYLAKRLTELGLETITRHYLIDSEALARLRSWSEGDSKASELTDVIGILPGRDRLSPAVVLMAHYDTVWGSPGGGDDSIGIASVLEIVRAIKARGTPARDVIVLFTDGEELTLSGAHAFWDGDTLADRAGVVLNFEARGAGGRAAMFETGDGNAAMMALFGQSVAAPVANSLAVFAYRLMPNSTDFTVSHKRGLPGFNFAMLGRAQYYHSPLATMDRLDPRTLQDMGNQGLGIASALAFTPELPAKTVDATFFDVLGRHFIDYRSGFGWLVVLGALASLAVTWLGLMRAEATTVGEVVAGVGASLWLLCHAVLALTLLNLLSGSARHPNYYDRLAVLPHLETIAALACIAALIGYLFLRAPETRWKGALPAVVMAVFALLLGGPQGLIVSLALVGGVMGVAVKRGGVPVWGGWFGAVALLLLFAIGAQIEAAGAAWLLAWPAQILSLAAAVVAWIDPRFDRVVGLIVAAGAAVTVSAPLLPLAHLTFLGIGGPLSQTMAVFLLIGGTAFRPLAARTMGNKAMLAIGCVLVIAGVMAIHVRVMPLAKSVPGYELDK